MNDWSLRFALVVAGVHLWNESSVARRRRPTFAPKLRNVHVLTPLHGITRTLSGPTIFHIISRHR